MWLHHSTMESMIQTKKCTIFDTQSDTFYCWVTCVTTDWASPRPCRLREGTPGEGLSALFFPPPCRRNLKTLWWNDGMMTTDDVLVILLLTPKQDLPNITWPPGASTWTAGQLCSSPLSLLLFLPAHHLFHALILCLSDCFYSFWSHPTHALHTDLHWSHHIISRCVETMTSLLELSSELLPSVVTKSSSCVSVSPRDLGMLLEIIYSFAKSTFKFLKPGGQSVSETCGGMLLSVGQKSLMWSFGSYNSHKFWKSPQVMSTGIWKKVQKVCHCSQNNINTFSQSCVCLSVQTANKQCSLCQGIDTEFYFSYRCAAQRHFFLVWLRYRHNASEQLDVTYDPLKSC